MSTHSTISIEHEDGVIETIYCHSDGYLEHNGNILLHHYKTPELVQQLIDHGDLSILGKEIGEKHRSLFAFEYGSAEYQQHKKLCGEWCEFYKRDHGEDGVDKQISANFRELLNKLHEYNYLFRYQQGEWTWYVSYWDEREQFFRLAAEIADL